MVTTKNRKKYELDTQLPDWDDTRYFADPAIDQSQLKQYIRKPAEWAYERLNPTERKSTPSQIFGTAFHAFILGTATVTYMPEGLTLRSKEGKAWAAEQQAAGNLVVSKDQYDQLQRSRDQLEAAPEYAKLVEEGYPEQTILWTDPYTGIRLKAKPDLIPQGVDYFVDLKTARTSDPDDFAREAFKYGYAMQSCFYTTALNAIPDPRVFGRIHRKPTGCHFWVWGKDDRNGDFRDFAISRKNPMFDNARRQLRSALTRLAADVRRGEDAGLGEGLEAAAKWCLIHSTYRKGTVELTFPHWILDQAEHDLDNDDPDAWKEIEV